MTNYPGYIPGFINDWTEISYQIPDIVFNNPIPVTLLVASTE